MSVLPWLYAARRAAQARPMAVARRRWLRVALHRHEHPDCRFCRLLRTFKRAERDSSRPL